MPRSSATDPPRPHQRPARPSPQRRPAVSRQRYALRRAMAATVLVFVVLGALVLVRGVFGGASTGAGASAPGAAGTTVPGPAGSAVEVTAPPDGGDSAITVGATAPGASTGVPDDTTGGTGEPLVPTPTTPARLLIVGDSDAGTFGPFLETLVDATGVVTTQLDYKVSSGLARPDFFDWPAHLQTLLASADPDIVVVTFGGNDAQALTDTTGAVLVGVPSGEAGGDAEWRAEYATRVRAVVEALRADGRAVVWVGIPNAVDDDFTARLRVQDETVRAVLAEYPDVRFVDTWARFSGRSGNYAEFVIDPRDGQGKDVRADDGFHLNVAGAEILALDIAAVITEVLRAAGAEI